MAILILAEAGELDYDDALSKYFPQFPSYAQKITIRHLLHHTSGLQDYMELFLKKNRKGFEPTSREALELLAQEKNLNLRFEPGEKWEYSNSGYLVLAMLVEQVSGQPFPEFVKENVFEPLEMNDTLVYDETSPQVKNRAKSYTREPTGYRNIDYHPLNLIYGDGAVNSSLEDLYKWDQALYTEKLVKQLTLKEAFSTGTLNDGSETDYGFGWSIGEFCDSSFVEHGGAWVGFRTYIIRFLSERLSVIVLSNFAQLDVEDLSAQIARIYLAHKIKTSGIKIADNILKSYVGRYELKPGVLLEITFEGGELFLSGMESKKGRLVAHSEVEFFLDELKNSRVTFEKDDLGRVRALTLHQRGNHVAKKLSP
jgi:CubicO group peptidase (beta-lactamase class C family)